MFSAKLIPPFFTFDRNIQHMIQEGAAMIIITEEDIHDMVIMTTLLLHQINGVKSYDICIKVQYIKYLNNELSYLSLILNHGNFRLYTGKSYICMHVFVFKILFFSNLIEIRCLVFIDFTVCTLTNTGLSTLKVIT